MNSFKSHLNEMSKKDLQKKVTDLDKRLDKHSNAGRVLNTGKISKDEFKQLLKKKVADNDVEVIPPNTGDNQSSTFDMFSFEFLSLYPYVSDTLHKF